MLQAEPDGSRHAWGILSLTSPASEKHILVYSLGWKNVVFYQKYRGLSEQSFFLIKISPSQGKIWLFFGGGKYPQKSETSNKMQHRRMGPGGETRSRRAPSCCSHGGGLPLFLHWTFNHQNFHIFLVIQVFWVEIFRFWFFWRRN